MSTNCTLCVTFGYIWTKLEDQDRTTNISTSLTSGFVLGVLAHANGSIGSKLCVEHIKSIRETVETVPDAELKTKLLQALNLGLVVVK